MYEELARKMRSRASGSGLSPRPPVRQSAIIWSWTREQIRINCEQNLKSLSLLKWGHYLATLSNVVHVQPIKRYAILYQQYKLLFDEWLQRRSFPA